MTKQRFKYYSVYRRKTDMPVIIHARSKECLSILGVSLATFYTYVSHTKNGTRKCKYEIYVDEEPESEEVEDTDSDTEEEYSPMFTDKEDEE